MIIYLLLRLSGMHLQVYNHQTESDMILPSTMDITIQQEHEDSDTYRHPNTTISLLWQNKCHKPTMTGAGWNPTHWWWLGDFTVTGGHRPRLASPGTKAPSRQPMINHTGRLEVWLGKCGMCGHDDRERETERERETHTHNGFVIMVYFGLWLIIFQWILWERMTLMWRVHRSSSRGSCRLDLVMMMMMTMTMMVSTNQRNW